MICYVFGWKFNPFTRLTNSAAADIYVLNAPLDEVGSRLGRLP